MKSEKFLALAQLSARISTLSKQTFRNLLNLASYMKPIPFYEMLFIFHFSFFTFH